MFNRRTLLAAGTAATVLPSFARAAETPAAQLSKLLDTAMDEQLAQDPESVTQLGLDKGARAAAKSQLTDRSLAGVARQKAQTASELARLKAIDRKALSGMDAVNYDHMAYQWENAVEGDRRFDYGDAGVGQPYVVSQLTGAYQRLPDFLGSQHVIETKADADAYLARLEAAGGVIDSETERARRDFAKGVIPPDFALDRALEQLTPLRSAKPNQSPLVRSVADRAKAKGIPGDYEALAQAIFAEKIVPALDRQIAAVKEGRAKATHDAGVWRLPDGDAYYALSLKDSTTTSLTPDEIHAIGLEQARELSARADVLLKGQGMTQGSVAERIQALYQDRSHRYPNDDTGKAKLLEKLNAQVKAMQTRLPEYFATLPKAPLEIKRVPPFIEAGAPGGYYNSPSLDGTRPGIYWINLRDTAEYPDWTLPTLTYHEGIPGHHLQLSLQQEADLPLLRKAQFISSYGEGWALYAELLAQEMGVYEDDPLGEIGYLQSSLFRAARLVVDTGIHAKHWSREQAIASMLSIDGGSPTETTTEVERYCVWPGQACSYMIGKLTWVRLREKAKAALGDRFDIRAFHDWGLLPGVMPLAVLEGVIDRQIATARAA